MLPTCFSLYRPSSGQYFTEIPGNYNMSYIELKRLLCVAVRNFKTIRYYLLVPGFLRACMHVGTRACWRVHATKCM
jgi:hypothetical protein